MKTYIIRWAVNEKVEVYSISAASVEDAGHAFEMVKLPGVRVISIDLDEASDDGAVGSPDTLGPRPTDPLATAKELEDQRAMFNNGPHWTAR